MTERVLLFGGPFDGEYLDVDPACNLRTLSWIEGYAERVYGGASMLVPQREQASYRRIGRHTFTHCRTPTKFGDTADSLAFPDKQLTLEDPDDRNDD